MAIITNIEQVFRVFDCLHQAYQNREFPYTEYHLSKLPQKRIPSQLRKIPNFYFYLCHFMRGRIKSDYAVVQMVKLYREQPELFNPTYVVTLSPEIMEVRLSELFGKLPPSQRYGEAWYRNSELLLAWGGNILNVFKGKPTAEMLRDRVVNKKNYKLPPKKQGFFMFQEKLCAMLAYFLMDAGLVRAIRISPPIDFHHLRVMIGTEMLAAEEVNRPRPLSIAGYKLAEQYLRKRKGVNPVEFADLMFMLSREGCARAVLSQKADWMSKLVQRRYRGTCGRCPVEKMCQHSVFLNMFLF